MIMHSKCRLIMDAHDRHRQEPAYARKMRLGGKHTTARSQDRQVVLPRMFIYLNIVQNAVRIVRRTMKVVRRAMNMAQNAVIASSPKERVRLSECALGPILHL